MNIKITGSGSYIPSNIVSNHDFANHTFLNEDGSPFAMPNNVITEKFYGITGIQERIYASNDLTTSDMGFLAAQKAIENAAIDPETLDYIIFFFFF